jgi:hypothetical protein
VDENSFISYGFVMRTEWHIDLFNDSSVVIQDSYPDTGGVPIEFINDSYLLLSQSTYLGMYRSLNSEHFLIIRDRTDRTWLSRYNDLVGALVLPNYARWGRVAIRDTNDILMLKMVLV